MNIAIKKIHPDAIVPEYQTAGAAGADIHARLDAPVTLASLERRMIPTGLAMAIPEGYEVQIRARSGMSIKHGITMVNGIGTIDADYRGEIGVILINLSDTEFTVNDGDRIAQMVIAKHDCAVWEEVAEISETDRGKGGCGSTSH